MGKSISNAMNYERTGNVRSKRNVIEKGMFKDLKTSNIILGGLRELYSRYATEIWCTLFFVLVAHDIWVKL